MKNPITCQDIINRHVNNKRDYRKVRVGKSYLRKEDTENRETDEICLRRMLLHAPTCSYIFLLYLLLQSNLL